MSAFISFRRNVSFVEDSNDLHKHLIYPKFLLSSIFFLFSAIQFYQGTNEYNFIPMKKKTIRTIFLSLVLLLAVGVSLAFYMYRMGPPDVKNSRGIAIKAIDLYSQFDTDTIEAGKMYTDKILEVSGTLKNISLNLQQQQVILLKTTNTNASINCTMELPIPNLKPSDKIIIKGICCGEGQADIDMGIPADVYLTRCYSQSTNNNP